MLKMIHKPTISAEPNVFFKSWKEEKLFRNILDKIALIGTKDKGIYWIDKEIGSLRNGQTETSAQ